MFTNIKIFNSGEFKKIKIEHVNLFDSFEDSLAQVLFIFNMKFYNYP